MYPNLGGNTNSYRFYSQDASGQWWCQTDAGMTKCDPCGSASEAITRLQAALAAAEEREATARRTVGILTDLAREVRNREPYGFDEGTESSRCIFCGENYFINGDGQQTAHTDTCVIVRIDAALAQPDVAAVIGAREGAGDVAGD